MAALVSTQSPTPSSIWTLLTQWDPSNNLSSPLPTIQDCLIPWSFSNPYFLSKSFSGQWLSPFSNPLLSYWCPKNKQKAPRWLSSPTSPGCNATTSTDDMPPPYHHYATTITPPYHHHYTTTASTSTDDILQSGANTIQCRPMLRPPHICPTSGRIFKKLATSWMQTKSQIHVEYQIHIQCMPPLSILRDLYLKQKWPLHISCLKPCRRRKICLLIQFGFSWFFSLSPFSSPPLPSSFNELQVG